MRLISWIILLGLLQTLAGAQVLVPDPSYKHAPLVLHDAKGRIVSGSAADASQIVHTHLLVTVRYSPTEVRPGDRITLRVQAELVGVKVRYRWAQTQDYYLFFETSDCTGQAYLQVTGNLPGGRVAMIDDPSNTLYLSEPDPSFSLREYRSTRYTNQVCQDFGGSALVTAAPVGAALDLDDYFTLPFEVR